MSRPLAVIFFILFVFNQSLGDIFMHNPRGSNNRNDEASRGRANANRLFDSQNNDRGGHNVGSFQGSMYFYAGSKLEIQWANQHSCGDQNNNCQVIIQYMCDDNLRDGTTTDEPEVWCGDDCDTNPEFGHHESLTYYEQCASRERNFGLFVADRDEKGKIAGDSAQHTRQNNAGTRYGFECPEERDYYPYFGPTPWIDIAVFSRNYCAYYKEESQNVKSRWACSLPDSWWDLVRGNLLDENERTEISLAFNKEDCEATWFEYEDEVYNGTWKEYPAHGVDAPDCLHELYSRDNHQGNTYGGEYLSYLWTVPDIDEKHCALRIRYNISTNDYDYWETDHESNGALGPSIVWKRLGFCSETDARRRGYIYKNNPQLDIFNLRDRKKNFRLQINIDVTQFGRTFQDRSHSFSIKKRPDNIGADESITNINVRGKRGNIVQNYPTPEYDFVPTVANIKSGDYVHIQWTGSDNNNPNNDGQGKKRTDRHNLVQLRLREYDEGVNGGLSWGTNYPRDVGQNTLWGLNSDQITQLAFSGDYVSDKIPTPTLDKADAYFDLGPVAITNPGIYYYFSTRNNAFTNRDQKGKIVVE